MSIIRLDNLSKFYTSQTSVATGLTGISLSFDVGEMVAVTGESGSGKSTLAHVLGGIIPYESGELYVYEAPTSHYDGADWEDYRRDTVSFISQNYGILAGNTVAENVESALRFYGVSADEAKEIAEGILKKVDLYEHRSKRADRLSSGQKQRLSIARALAKPSKILIADEPTGNLDRENSEKIMLLLKEASEERLVILITHDFDEVKELATRQVIISDGAVVADIPLHSAAKVDRAKPEKNTEIASAPAKRKKIRGLSPYVARLILKSRPTFSVIICLLLAFTTFITFSFLGTFISELDDSDTKIYESDSFANGDPLRLILMKAQGAPFTPEDFEKILSIERVSGIEKHGYSADINYFYRPDTDYYLYNAIVNGPNYHPVTNPDDFYLVQTPRFTSFDLFIRTVPVTNESIITAGRAPVGCYEVLSADPNYKIGDTVEVYVQDTANWSLSSYIGSVFTVVGETDHGEGLYFSDDFATAISGLCEYDDAGTPAMLNYNEKVLILPYNPEGFTVTQFFDETLPSDGSTGGGYVQVAPRPNGAPNTPEDGKIELKSGEAILTEFLIERLRAELGDTCHIKSADSVFLKIEAKLSSTYSRLVLLSEEDFNAVLNRSEDNQINAYVTDYAYAERVMRALGNDGYISISPFKLGATISDPELETERMTTLIICLAAFLVSIVLEIILLRVLFSFLNEPLRLMSNVGMCSDSAFSALSLLMLLFTAIGELLGIGSVILLNSLGVMRIVNIFKHLEWYAMLILVFSHVLSVAVTFIFILKEIRRNVFPNTTRGAEFDMPREEVA